MKGEEMFGYIDNFCRFFPGTGAEEAVIALWVTTAERIAADVVRRDDGTYVVLTPQIVNEVIHVRGNRKTIGKMLGRMVEIGALERVDAGRSRFAYRPTQKAVLAMHVRGQNLEIPRWAKNAHQVGKNCPPEVSKNCPPQPINYINNNVNTHEVGKNCPPLLEDPDSQTPSAQSKKSKTSDEIEAAFERFWSAYPKHRAKAEAKKRFVRLKLHREIDDLLAAVRNYTNDPTVKENLLNGHLEYVKNPDTFLLTRGVEYWRDYIRGGATLNAAALGAGANGGAKKGGDERIAKFAAKIRAAIRAIEAANGGDVDPTVPPSQTAAKRFFDAATLAVMDRYNEQHPLVYQEYETETYARFVLEKIGEGRDG